MSTTSLRRTQFAVAKQHGRVRTLSAGSAAVVLDNTIVTHNGIAGAHTTTGGGAIFTRQDNAFQFNNTDVWRADSAGGEVSTPAVTSFQMQKRPVEAGAF